MSVNLSIKSVPEDWAERLRQRAERNHRSLQGELMALVERAVNEAAPLAPAASAGARRGTLSVEDLSRRAAERYAGLPARSAGIPTGTEIVRQMRDARWG
jgi:plasmid stability protein